MHKKRKIACAYHSCKNKGYLYRCKYCGDYFCEEHLRATPAGPPRFRGTSSEDRIFMEEWNKPGGHPCVPYMRYWEEENKKQGERFGAALDKMKYSDLKGGNALEKVNVYTGSKNVPKDLPNNIKPNILPSINLSVLSSKRMWGSIRRSLYLFIEYTLIFLVILVVLNLYILGKFSLIPIIIRSIGFALIMLVFEYIYKKTQYHIPWKWLIIAIIVVLVAYLFTGKTSVIDPLNNIIGINNFTNGTILPLFNYFKNLNYTSVYNNSSNQINTFLNDTLPQPIDSKWVASFMTEVNNGRKAKGLLPLQGNPQLDAIAYSRFNTMITHPEISHYGAGAYNVGEVVFYPEGFTPHSYAINIQETAPLHWQGLMDPSLSYYGYYTGTGPTIEIIGSCSTTEIPGPNIDVPQFFQQHGCQTTTGTSMWLVIDMS